MNINAGGASASTMNNGRKDTTASDVQKLQEQLNDIKEQVKYEMNRSSVKMKSFSTKKLKNLTNLLPIENIS